MSALAKVWHLAAWITGARLDYVGGRLYLGPWQIMRTTAFDQHELKMFELGRDEESGFPSIEGARRLSRSMPGVIGALERGD